jgi:hypothetical protein
MLPNLLTKAAARIRQPVLLPDGHHLSAESVVRTNVASPRVKVCLG